MERIKSLGSTLTTTEGILQLLKQKSTLAGIVLLLLLWGVEVEELQVMIDSTMKIVLSLGALGAVVWDENAGK